MDNKDAQYLYNIEGCLSLRDFESVKAWLERARKSSQPKAFDDIVLTVAPLLGGIIGKEAAHPVIIEIRDQLTQIQIRLAAEAAEAAEKAAEKAAEAAENRRKAEEQRIQESESYLDSNQIPYSHVERGDLPSFAKNIKRKRLEKEQRIQESESYLDSNQIPYSHVKRGDLPSFAENIKRERLVQEKIRLLKDNHKSFLLRKGLDPDIRFLISLNTPNRRRITHCYQCRSHLDEAQDWNCSVCRWILCPCGACGCGYENQ